ncbi:FtsX-like permease family protein [Clostridium gasigenes]|uniref:ABC transporter permease n=1 Tax=Clostridium gasigenes TaxID=94869 RepID=UPI001C0AB2B9|nr:ABC transporter permease [Clostridium gasigenes]MBU3132074.1 FtsX-like permease family protein [Clostridium gasigenes]
MKGNVIREIAVKNLKTSKKSNIVLGIAIAIVSAFLTVILAFSYSMDVMCKAENSSGFYNAMISSTNSDTVENLRKHALVDKVGEIISSNFSITIKDDIIYSNFSDDVALGLEGVKITEGRNAQEKDEIVLEKEFVEKHNLKIGDSVKTNEGETLKVAGVSVSNVKSIGNNYGGYVSREKALEEKNTVVDDKVNSEKWNRTTLITVNSKWNIEKKLNSIADDLGYKSGTDFFINSEMLGVSEDAIVSFIVLSLIIIASAFFIIYNLVSINFVERIKNYGLLVTIGTSRKQLKKIMWWEVFILSIIAIPFGLFIGGVIGKVIIPIIPLEAELKVIYKLWFIPIVVGITLATVFISIRGPVKRSTKISPIEAVKYTSDNNVKKRIKIKESKNVFNDLAKVNIWRSKRSTLIIIISLTLSGILFIVVSTLIKSMDIDSYVKSYFVPQDIRVSLKNEMDIVNNEGIAEKTVDEVKSIKGVKNIYSNKKTGVKLDNIGYDIFSLNAKDIEKLEQYLVSGSLKKEDYIEKDKLIIRSLGNIENKYKVKDIVPVEVNGKIKNFEVGAIVNNDNLIANVKSTYALLVYEENDVFNGVTNFSLDIEVENGEEAEIKNILKNNNDNIEVVTYNEVKEKEGKNIKTMSLIGYLILGVIGLIGILNYIVTIITSVLSRKKEFGIIRALGVKEKELRNMVMKEGLYLSGIIGLVTLTLGNILGYRLYLAFKTEATYAIYSFPWIQNIILLIVLVIVPLIMYRIAIKKIIRVPVVEQIKYSE